MTGREVQAVIGSLTLWLRTFFAAVAMLAALSRSFLSAVGDLGRSRLAHAFAFQRLVFLLVLDSSLRCRTRHPFLRFHFQNAACKQETIPPEFDGARARHCVRVQTRSGFTLNRSLEKSYFSGK